MSKKILLLFFSLKQKLNRRLKVKLALGYQGSFVVDPVGIEGGLAIFWREFSMTKLIGCSRQHIDIQVCVDGLSPWRLIGFYGYSYRGERRSEWNLLWSLSVKSELPWWVVGDFYDIMFVSKKQGNERHPRWLMEGLRKVLANCQLSDMGYYGCRFTWKNRHQDDYIQERLDRDVTTILDYTISYGKIGGFRYSSF